MGVQVYKFGTGSLYGVKTSGVGPGTPLQFGGLQDVSVEFSFTNKELHGQKVFPLAIARGEGKVTGKASMAQVYGQIYNDLFFGASMTEGAGLALEVNEVAVIPSATPYTVVVANASTLVDDLGVKYLSGGDQFTKVAATPAIGEYSEVAGTYTFAAADTGLSVVVSYAYTTAIGKTISVVNELQGQAPTFGVWFATTYNGQQAVLKLAACVSNKLSMPSKLADWNIDQLDFDAFEDAAGNIATISVPV